MAVNDRPWIKNRAVAYGRREPFPLVKYKPGSMWTRETGSGTLIYLFRNSDTYKGPLAPTRISSALDPGGGPVGHPRRQPRGRADVWPRGNTSSNVTAGHAAVRKDSAQSRRYLLGAWLTSFRCY